MAENVLGFVRKLSIQRWCPYLSPDTFLSSSQRISARPRCLHRHFSVSTRTLLPRTRPHPNGYPGFRNESKERRYVREHNLFDPQSQSPDSIDDASYLSDPLESARTLTRPPRTLPWRRASTSELERELLFLASRFPTSPRSRNLLHHILYDRGEQPNAIHYEALILANASPEHGSAENVRKLAEEMEQQMIPMNINIYNAILRTLAVHPDVNILNEVIEACGKLWIEIDSEMRHLICAIYLRAGMHEIALEYLEQIEYGSGTPALGTSRPGLQRGKAELWLYVVFIQQLTEHDDWEGVMRLCYRLCDDTSLGIPLASRHMDVPYAFWNWLLEQAAAAKDKWVTFWIWDKWVLKAWVKPSFETCMQALEVCADHGAIRVAETAATILRFISKETNKPSPDYDSQNEASLSLDQGLDRVKTLLAKTYENATPREPRPSELEIRRITAEWWMFDIEDRIGLNSKGKTGLRSLRLNPWSMLREFNDPGHAWARVLSEEEDAQQTRDEREALRKAHVRRANIDAGRATMMKTLPPQLLEDIERAASAELDIEETGVVDGERSEAIDFIVSSDEKPNKSADAEDDQLQPRIRLIDPKRTALNAKVENARIAKWEKLGLDIQTALKMDGSRGNRAWTLQDTKDKDKDGEDEEDNTTESKESQRKTGMPRVRLVKLAETSPNAEWYSEWSEMLAARRRFERAVQRKRDAEARKSERKSVSGVKGGVTTDRTSPPREVDGKWAPLK